MLPPDASAMYLIRFADDSYLDISPDGSWRYALHPEEATLFRTPARAAWAASVVDRDDDQRLWLVPVEPY